LTPTFALRGVGWQGRGGNEENGGPYTWGDPILRGALSRWLIETAPGLYVGTVSARVRHRRWSGRSTPPADNEQGSTIHTAGERRRLIANFDGLQLVRFLPEPHS
jgi:CRISPR-associated endoribonuclease Cas2 subtype I-E